MTVTRLSSCPRIVSPAKQATAKNGGALWAALQVLELEQALANETVA